MNRRQFLQSLLGAAAVAALPTAVLAAAEEAAGPLADPYSWTPSNYVFSVFVKRNEGVTKALWERVSFNISKELGDALAGGAGTNSGEGRVCLNRVLRTIGQKNADMFGFQLEERLVPPTFAVDWYAPTKNLLPDSVPGAGLHYSL